jgi:eukaryotic-like serine/threonine-protein kinase
MGPTAPGRTWDLATSPSVARIASRFESVWSERSADPPDPRSFLPQDPAERSGALLALLRIDLRQRRRTRRTTTLEWYGEHFPELGDEGLVALIYEEFCLREEEGGHPDPAEYEQRFPALASSVRELLDIHDLVGSAGSSSLSPFGREALPFPEVGQTIAGFRLVEELGRGTFARVYRACDRTLADRAVALKVSRAGCREPQTLARLQHTNIVPIYSRGIDPVGALQYLCMPYFGRITLASLLAEPAIQGARSGAELAAVIERAREDGETMPIASRESLTSRSYPRAIALWGARLAEALGHAHDRGILHRDVKPSNVLITSDGEPMLLDFNLAHESNLNGLGRERLGGTLAYMAPEHLEAIAEGRSGGVDHRADLYSLGVVLYEALGSRPFSPLTAGSSATESLLNAALQRKLGPPRIRDRRPDVPAELEAVLQKCLAADLAVRYASAAELARDLHAVADDLPLPFAREPWGSRFVRTLRRNRRGVAVAAFLSLVVLSGVAFAASTLSDRSRVDREAMRWIQKAETSASLGRYALASSQFASALALTHDYRGFNGLDQRALEGKTLADRTDRVTTDVDAFLARAESLKFALLKFGDGASVSREVQALLERFGILQRGAGRRDEELALLDPARRERFHGTVNDLLFLWIKQSYVAGDREVARRGSALCDLALEFVEPKGPWRELKRRFTGDPNPLTHVAIDPAERSSARACFQRGMLSVLDGDAHRTLSWFSLAVENDPNDYWARFAYAIYLAQSGQVELALEQYSAAIVLRPDSPWAYVNRGQILWKRPKAFAAARADLERAVTLRGDQVSREAEFELGVLLQATGDLDGARQRFQKVLAAPGGVAINRKSRNNLARLDADQGAIAAAFTSYDDLVDKDPGDSEARWGRALLSLRVGRLGSAEQDLTVLLDQRRSPHDQSRVHADRALVRLASGQLAGARDDVQRSCEIDPAPDHRRVLNRVLLAADSDVDFRADEPESLLDLPFGGSRLLADLSRAAERLASVRGNDLPALAAARNRAVILSALGRHVDALAEADRSLAIAPNAAASLLVRARVLLRAGDFDRALEDVQRGLEIEPDAARLIELRGRIWAAKGDLERALADFSTAISLGDGAGAYAHRAAVRHALGRAEAAIADWTEALKQDPQAPSLYLGRAQSLAAKGQWDYAFADLEDVLGRVDSRSRLYQRALMVYIASLPARPDRLSRVWGILRRTWSESQARRS